jgi:hypothetical protein
MNFSNEELYSMYGQYDSFVSVEFRTNSDSYKKYGASLMGAFKYLEKEREELEAILKTDEITRIDKEVLFFPSELENLTDIQKIDLDRVGILCSDIDSISTVNLPRTNRYIVNEKKEIPNIINIEINTSALDDIIRISYGFLKSRYLKDKNLSPKELCEYYGLRNYFADNIDDEFKDLTYKHDKSSLIDKYRIHELRAKLRDLKITDDEMLDYILLVSNEIKNKDTSIKRELNRTTEKLNELKVKYGDEIENIERICRKFDERVLLYGDKLIYLDIERFLHIYIRHVTETQISDKFSGKTVFQYKFDDIIRLIHVVLDSISNEIQKHFKENPERTFTRIGQRSEYFDGHYYRVEIEANGRLLEFHPYNNAEEKDNDK